MDNREESRVRVGFYLVAVVVIFLSVFGIRRVFFAPRAQISKPEVIQPMTLSHPSPTPSSETLVLPRQTPQRSRGNRPPVADAPSAIEPPAPDPSLGVLEQRYLATRSTEVRVELAGEVAGRNSAEAVEVLARLFRAESHPTAKESLLSALGDIDKDQASETRLRILSAAVQGHPRNVRSNALTLLADLEDPRAVEILRVMMTKDPDSEVRELATALFTAIRDEKKGAVEEGDSE